MYGKKMAANEKTMKFDNAFVRYLEDMGVKYIFGVPGDIQTEFFEAVRKSSIQFVTVRNEKCAVFMADVYSRVSGNIGVCFSTVGPGATNLISGVTNATGDKSSVIAISDQMDECFLESHQYVDQEKLFSPSTGVTKDQITLTADKLKNSIERAYTQALSEPKGAVQLAMPVELHSKDVEYSKPNLVVEDLPQITTADELNSLILGKKNLVLVGGVVSRCGINKEFIEWIERCNIPVLSTFRGKGTMPDSHPLFLSAVSRYLIDDIAPILKEIENLILIGYDYNEGVKPKLWKDSQCTIVNINTHDNHVKGIFEPEVNFVGDLASLFSSVDAKGADYLDIPQIKEQIKSKIYGDLDMNVYPPRPHRIMEAINEHFPDAIKVCDVGKNKYYSGLLLNAQEPNSILFSNMQSAMSFSSGALGATFATDKPVLAITGDGGFMMEPQEIAAAMRYHKKLVIIVINDNGLGLVRAKQLMDHNIKYEVDFPNPDFVKFAESFGAKGYSIKSWGELSKVMKEASQSEMSCIIEVPVDYSEGI